MLAVFCAVAGAATPADLSKSKPKPEALLKTKSLQEIRIDQKSVTNAQWEGEDFGFISGALIPAPLYFSRAKVVDPAFYRALGEQMKSFIQKLEYDPQKKIAELEGEKAGLKLHSWIRIDDRLWDEIHMRVIRGDLAGMEIKVYFWDEGGKTLFVGKGELGDCRSGFSGLIAKLLPIVGEGVIDVATNHFHDTIKDEYDALKKQN